ncbi:DUF4145 domain-containing protein [Microbacterium sp. KSW4-17]|uniref:DUF4145 domain-containing protein n=1 Tax=Microbacterium galbum TaxID=3075994 RepID=A0ABU3T673_9MICO|nr:DUF4145 domain-containing protein [Microbacterium sp. KSW4-17]MDU0366865.1 DUF4145 domain-containing protein [Microbacterium sp. KSW4-17]
MDATLASCPHCGLLAQQIPATPRIVTQDEYGEQAVWTISDDDQGFRASGEEIVARDGRMQREAPVMSEQVVPEAPWQVRLCVACKKMSFLLRDVVIYPAGVANIPAPHPDMPQHAKALYHEAASVFSGSRRAAAALGRASLEALLKAVDDDPGTRRDLNQRIGALRPRINDSLWKVLTALRVVGNDALHREDGELIAIYLNGEDDALAETFLPAINELVEELITRPRKADALYAMIPENTRAAAERAAGDA